MELVKMLNVTILACLLILTGCIGGGTGNADDGITYVIEAIDHEDMVENNDGLMNVTIVSPLHNSGNGSGLEWSLIEFVVVKNGVEFVCDNPGLSGGDCGLTQHQGANADYWDLPGPNGGEWVYVVDTGFEFCHADCELDLIVRYKAGGDIASATVWLE